MSVSRRAMRLFPAHPKGSSLQTVSVILSDLTTLSYTVSHTKTTGVILPVGKASTQCGIPEPAHQPLYNSDRYAILMAETTNRAIELWMRCPRCIKRAVNVRLKNPDSDHPQLELECESCELTDEIDLIDPQAPTKRQSLPGVRSPP